LAAWLEDNSIKTLAAPSADKSTAEATLTATDEIHACRRVMNKEHGSLTLFTGLSLVLRYFDLQVFPSRFPP
jgi:hypothetical protein